MEKVTANQPFYGSRDEGMWAPGDTKEVTPERAKLLKESGLVGKPKEDKDEKEEKAKPATKEDKLSITTKDAK